MSYSQNHRRVDGIVTGVKMGGAEGEGHLLISIHPSEGAAILEVLQVKAMG